MNFFDDGVELVQWALEEVQGAEVAYSFSFYHSTLPQAYSKASLHQPPEMLSYQNNWVSNPTQTQPINF